MEKNEQCQNCRNMIVEYYDKDNFLCRDCSIDAENDRSGEPIPPNTYLTCNICGKDIGSVCMMSYDWSASMSFLNAARNHFEKEHGMKPKSDGAQGL